MAKSGSDIEKPKQSIIIYIMLNKRSVFIFLGFFIFQPLLWSNQNKAYATDTTSPVTTNTVVPSSANGKNGWYITPVTYTLNATDLESGVKEINYQVDSAPWQKVTFSDTLNLVPNPSFEEPDVGSPIYTKYWIKTSPGNSATYTRDTAVYAPGFDTVSIKISLNASGWHTISHTNNFAVATPYNNMNSSVWIKTDAVDAAYYKIFAVTQDQSGEKTYTEILESATLTGTNDWTKLSNSFTVNVNSAIGVFMEVGVEGKGTAWIDAASINDSVVVTSTNVSVGTDGEHTLKYYSVDRSDNVETTHTVSFKIDQTPPGNWHDSGAIRGLFGSDHELYVYTNVEDEISGLSVFTDKYQYHTKKNPGFGRFANILTCNSTWYPDGWFLLISPPFQPGVKSAYLITPKTDFCDNDWKICKTVKFYSEDMAGNVAIKDYCINGPWIKIHGQGVVGAAYGIDMLAEPLDYNTDGIIEIGNSNISFFTGLNNWVIKNQPFESEDNYDKFWNTAKNKTQMGATLPISSGVYYVNGNLTVDNAQIPSNYGSKIFNAIVFVNGILTVDRDLTINQASTLLFIVKQDAKIKKSLSSLSAGILADGDIYTAYDIAEGDATPTLILKGVYAANRIRLQRTLQGTGNKNDPSEDFTYEPKYVTNLADFLGEKSVKWLSVTGN
jgi:hypothetical protein